MCLLRKVPKLDILRLGLHYIFAGCGLVELGNRKKEVYGNLFWHNCEQCLLFFVCVLLANFFPVVFFLTLLYSRLWNFPTILFQIEKTEIEIVAEIISDFTGLRTIDELYKLHTWGISPSFHHCHNIEQMINGWPKPK